MKTILPLLFTLFFFIHISFAQNLVPNSSFEQYTQCPNDYGDIDKATHWESYSVSPDYYNRCTVNPDISVPYNGLGYQQPSSGDAYTGFHTYADFYPNVREYIAVQLDSNLVIGAEYDISIKVSLALDTTPNNIKATCASNNVGIKFTTSPSPNQSLSTTLVDNFAHVYESSIISDTSSWTTISGVLVADSAYQYLIVGNFFNDTSTLTQQLFGNECSVYYYLDDVVVERRIPSSSLTSKSIETDVRVFSKDKIIFISLEQSNNLDIEIFNLSGQLIKKVTHFSYTNAHYDCSSCANGMYLVKIKSGERVWVKKVLLD